MECTFYWMSRLLIFINRTIKRHNWFVNGLNENKRTRGSKNWPKPGWPGSDHLDKVWPVRRVRDKNSLEKFGQDAKNRFLESKKVRWPLVDPEGCYARRRATTEGCKKGPYFDKWPGISILIFSPRNSKIPFKLSLSNYIANY